MKVRTNMFIAANNDMSATSHQIVELCEWRGEHAYRPNQANNFNDEEIDNLIEHLCQLAVCSYLFGSLYE